jgi:hypothetical protein
MDNQRILAAKLAEQYYKGSLTFTEFIKKYPDSDDFDVNELFDLIEHEPKKGGLFGATELEHFNYNRRINNLIDKLKEK